MTDREYLEKYLKKEELEEGLKKLEEGISPQYIVGNVDFYGFNFIVDKRVLIPRFETEVLLEKTINYINKIFKDKVKILDIGTGSGCIATILSKKLNASVDGVDISNDAIELANLNKDRLEANVNFYVSDLFSNVEGKYDVIISNPPYISYDEEIEDIVKNNEPHIALYAPEKGLYFYENILKDASNYLSDRFLIAFEIGAHQGEEITNIAKKYFNQAIIRCEKDLSGFDRYIFIFNE